MIVFFRYLINLNIKVIHLIFFIIFLFTGCYEKKDSKWVETQATITYKKLENNEGFAYKIDYIVTESTAINAEGKKIEGLIWQGGISKEKPVPPFKLRIRYLREEPVVFEFIDPMHFEKTSTIR